MNYFENNSKWIFTNEQFLRMPTIYLSKYSFEEELLQRQLAAKFIADFALRICHEFPNFKKYELVFFLIKYFKLALIYILLLDLCPE